ncbi:MAG: diadenylate cyclase CdaA [bacterium]
MQLFNWQALVEIGLLACLIYFGLSFLRGSRGAGVLRGLAAVFVIIVVIFLTLAAKLDMYVLSWLINKSAAFVVFILIVVFQPELRGALLRVGQSPLFTRFVQERWDASQQITRAVMTLSRQRTGALIAVQRSVGLKTYTEGGKRLDAEVTAELLVSIFRPGSPLHDGAVVIKGDRVVAAACLFPLSENPNIDTSLGTRHRAGIGVTEESDAVAIIVSEETGQVSVAERGHLTRNVDEKALRTLLHAVSSEEGFQTVPAKELS